MLRIRQRHSGSYTLTAQPIDDDGETVSVTSATAVLFDGAGVAVMDGDEPKSYTVDATGDVLTLLVPVADVPLLDKYKAVITDGDNEWPAEFEIVGGFLCELEDLRAYPDYDPDSFSTDDLRRARTDAEEQIERLAMCAFVPRGKRVTRIADGSTTLLLPDVDVRSFYCVAINGADALVYTTLKPGGVLEFSPAPRRGATIAVHYQHGADEAPGSIRAGCVRLAYRYVVPDQLGGRRSVESTDIGTFRMSFGTRPGETGDPDLDAAIAAFGHKRPIVG